MSIKLLSILRAIAIGIIILIIFGFLIDLSSGFYVLQNSKSIYAGIAGLLLLAVFYLIVEAGADWIGSKDDVAHPLYKRFFHLLILLIYGGIIMVSGWFLIYYFGMIKI